MGQTQNSCDKLKEPIIKIHDSKSEIDPNDDSSYKGLKSENCSNENSNDTNESTPTSLSADENGELDAVLETTITWTEGGNEVFVTGSFSEWKQWFSMEKVGNIHILKLFLPKGKHYIKFIVDKIWVCSSYYETFLDDKGNLNNIINNLVDKEKLSVKDAHSIKPRNKEKKLRALSDASQNYYSDTKPERSNLKVNIPLLPCPYKSNFVFNIPEFDNKNLKLIKAEPDFKCAHPLNYSFYSTTSISLSTHANL